MGRYRVEGLEPRVQELALRAGAVGIRECRKQ